MVGAGKSSSKRRRRSNNDSAVVVDRLSSLSDKVLHHILSFLDTKLMVRTSVLSSRWRPVWKEATSLHFDMRNFTDLSKFEQHIGKLLSLRSQSAAISSLTLDHWGRLKGQGDDKLIYQQLFDRITEHAAASHDSRRLHHLSIRGAGRRCCFADTAGSIMAHGNHEPLKTLKLQESNQELLYRQLFDRIMNHAPSLHHLSMISTRLPGNRCSADLICAHGHLFATLKTLKLEDVSVEYNRDDGTAGTVFALGFKALTNLELRRCKLVTTPVKLDVVDPFASLPCLKYLKLRYCESMPSCLLRVSGLELLDLQIQYAPESSRPQKIQVFAPKLESFCFLGGTEQLGELNFPSRAYTNIDVKQPRIVEDDDSDQDYDIGQMLQIMEWRPPRRAAKKN